MGLGTVARVSGWAAMSLMMIATGTSAACPPQCAKRDAAEQPALGTEKNRAREDAQANATDAQQSDTVTKERSLKRMEQDFLQDQERIWTSPSRLRFSDTQWLVPLSGLTAGLLVTDRDFSTHLSHNPKTMSHYNTLSNAGIGALIGGAGGMWLLGHVRHNEHWSETGFLSGEAALNSLVLVESMKYSLRRDRPIQGDGSGAFFQSGGTSFPSEHAAAAWAIAGVIAHEYPGPLSKILAYGAASAISFSRVRARQHFPSDVFVGSLVGNLIAQDIYTRHHDPELPGALWNPLSSIFRSNGDLSPANHGSPYVPLDSWVYPAFDRLSAMGLIDSGFSGMRPWTRLECTRLLGQAGERIDTWIGGPEAERIYRSLESEFRDELETAGGGENLRARVESVYARVTGVSGDPLVDGNHFGQTITNDFGRPYQEGLNTVDGFSASATAGRWAGYVRVEYQHAPSAPPLPDGARQFIFFADNRLPSVPPPTPYATINRLQVLDAYIGLTFQDWQLSFGKQSLSWGPSQSGPLIFSDNALPVNMFRISRVSPFKPPSILGWLGPIRVEWFLGQLAGHTFVFQTDTGTVGQFGRGLGRQPFLQGQKISLKPTPDLEFGVSTTIVFAGGPTALTWHTFLRSYSISNGPTTIQGGPGDPGDRRSSVDFNYRVPGLRRWLSFYGEAMTEDEFSPLGYPRKSAIQGGIYLPSIPGLPKVDLRVEGGTTAPADFPGCVGCFYVNNRYPDGSYLNSGSLIGSWLGRAAQGERAWSTYWLSPRSSIKLEYRHQKVNGDYLPRGGTLNDGDVRVDLRLRPDVTFSGSVQYERWNYPLLAPK
jgi:hypothetical protein